MKAAVLLIGLILASFAWLPRPVHIFVAGDSTAAIKRADRRPETGWAEKLQAFFDSDAVRVVNLARNGRSTRTFLSEGRWDALLRDVQPGDYVLIQFGHNDQSESKPDRYTPPDAFETNLARFVEDVRARAATPVLLTPVVRRRFDAEGRFYDVHGSYPDLTRAVATRLDAALIDVHRQSEALVRDAGAEASKPLFLHLPPGDHPNYPAGLVDDTHLSPQGAERVARLVASGLAALAIPLAEDVLLPPRPLFDAHVDGDYEGRDGALVGERRMYRTLSAALAAAEGGEAFRVFLHPGRYREKLVVEHPDLHLVGAHRDSVVITFDDAGGTLGADGQPLGTGGSATLRVAAPGFRAAHLTIENSFDYPANATRSADDPNLIEHPQAVALFLDQGSDRTVLADVSLVGYQDTFFADAGRTYVQQSRISGHVDFIFGAGQVVFDRCEIVSRDRPGKHPTGYVTAPSTRADDPYGFLFVDSRFVKEPLVPAGSVALGRPWHPGNDSTANGSAVFIRSFMDDHIAADGYAPISGRSADGTRIWYNLEGTSRFFEYASSGPGALLGPRRPQLRADAAPWYTPALVLRDWTLPAD